jgi:hypothetical protein
MAADDTSPQTPTPSGALADSQCVGFARYVKSLVLVMFNHRSPCSITARYVQSPLAMFNHRSPCSITARHVQSPLAMFNHRSPCSITARYVQSPLAPVNHYLPLIPNTHSSFTFARFCQSLLASVRLAQLLEARGAVGNERSFTLQLAHPDNGRMRRLWRAGASLTLTCYCIAKLAA